MIGNGRDNVDCIQLVNAQKVFELCESPFYAELTAYFVEVLFVPPLRERGTDILLLARHFVEQFAIRANKQIAGISNSAAEKLLNYSWPGNVRELRNTIERAVVLTGYEKISVDDLPEKIRDYKASRFLLESDTASELVPVQEVERRYILHVLKTVGGNKTVAAKVLGLDRKTLYRKLEQYKVD